MTTIVAAITSKVSEPPYPNEVVIQRGTTGLQITSTVRLDQIALLIENASSVESTQIRCAKRIKRFRSVSGSLSSG